VVPVREIVARQEPATSPPATAWLSREPEVAPEETRAIVLTYHTLASSQMLRAVSPEEFERQLLWMRDNHVEIVPLSRLVDHLLRGARLPRKVAVVTIDDGERGFYLHGYPAALRHRVPFALGLPTLFIEQAEKRKTLTWEMIREMLASGLCEIASHSHTHSDLIKLSPRWLTRELALSRELIEQHTGVKPASFFYPMGSLNHAVVAETRRHGYEAGFIAMGGQIQRSTDPFRIPRFDIRGDTDARMLQILFARAAIETSLRPAPPPADGKGQGG
jgi:peptidoglycan/xylan/chitin deacetylase (PgdA/CDA1 family)